MNYKESFIKFMVESGVLTFGDFTLKSGRKAPYFVNTGNYNTGAQSYCISVCSATATALQWHCKMYAGFCSNKLLINN